MATYRGHKKVSREAHEILRCLRGGGGKSEDGTFVKRVDRTLQGESKQAEVLGRRRRRRKEIATKETRGGKGKRKGSTSQRKKASKGAKAGDKRKKRSRSSSRSRSKSKSTSLVDRRGGEKGWWRRQSFRLRRHLAREKSQYGQAVVKGVIGAMAGLAFKRAIGAT